MFEVKLAIVGCRWFTDYEEFKRLLNLQLATFNITPIHIISGGARGIDSLAKQWADENNIPTTIHLPDYEIYGKSAPFIRNTLIIEDAQVVISFWDKKSRGTKDSIEKAKKLEKILIEITI